MNSVPPVKVPTDLSRFLREERARIEKNLDQLAVLLTAELHVPKPISKGTISTWETGKRLISPPTLDALGRVFGWDDETRHRVAMLYQEASIERSKSKAA